MDSNDLKHSALGQIGKMVGVPSKSQLKEYAMLGAGAAVGITATDLLLSRVLVKNGQPMIPVQWNPLAIAVAGILLGGIAKKKISGDVGTGMIAGTVGVAIAGVAAKYMSPATAASAVAAQSAEDAGAGAQQTSGFGLGRAFARGLGGLGRLGAVRDQSLLFGVGTPDMGASKMFSGATVAIEDNLSGATVQYEPTSNFAGVIQ